MEGFIGVDIGTSGVRAVLFDENGFETYLSHKEYSILSTGNGWAELDADTILSDAFKSIRDCAGYASDRNISVYSMGLSSQMHSLMAVDAHGSPLTNLMIWADVRAADEASFISQTVDPGVLYKTTGCRAGHPMYPAGKILWLRNNRPDVFNKAFKFITIKEYLIFKLFGEYLVDHTLAGCQGFFDLSAFKWSQTLLDLLGIGADRLSEPVECTFVLKGMNRSLAADLGLDPGMPVIIGSGDGILANVGSGVLDNSAFASTIGTSGAIRTSTSRPVLAPNQETWCYPFLRHVWVSGGAINNGGLVLKWLREEFREQFNSEAREQNKNIYRLFDDYAAGVAPGSEGLVFLPFLTGERSPDWNAQVRGMMFGLSLTHGKKHIVRAAMEGILFRLFSVYNVLKELNPGAGRLIASGGYARSAVWLQMQADLFNREICVTPVNQTSALGAAYLAMLGTGRIKGYGERLPAMEVGQTYSPDPSLQETYVKAYRHAMDVYHRLYDRP